MSCLVQGCKQKRYGDSVHCPSCSKTLNKQLLKIRGLASTIKYYSNNPMLLYKVPDLDSICNAIINSITLYREYKSKAALVHDSNHIRFIRDYTSIVKVLVIILKEREIHNDAIEGVNNYLNQELETYSRYKEKIITSLKDFMEEINSCLAEPLGINEKGLLLLVLNIERILITFEEYLFVPLAQFKDSFKPAGYRKTGSKVLKIDHVDSLNVFGDSVNTILRNPLPILPKDDYYNMRMKALAGFICITRIHSNSFAFRFVVDWKSEEENLSVESMTF